nr:glutathione S-transferase [Tatlockia sp.]
AFPNPQHLRLFMFEKGIESELEEIVYDMAPGGDRIF